MILYNYYLIILLICETTGDNSLSNFICSDGSLIKLKFICDGIIHCTDGSDETKSLCNHILCPYDKFRCYYGACVNKAFRCDGKFQCVDKSDENTCDHNTQSCGISEFQCLSQECIPQEKLCDGSEDCEDGSDENSDSCDVPCPEKTYRCKHGGCVHLNARCNGFKDCVDGSDESELLCKSLNCTNKECNRILKEVSCPPIVSTRIIVKCQSTGNFKKGWIACDKPVPIGAIAHYECKPYYEPINSKQLNNNHSICQPDGTWSREYLKCQPECGNAYPEVDPLVVYGWIAERGKWPWHCTIYNLRNGNWSFWCGGSLISERAIVTAAHCVWKTNKETLKVALGKYTNDFDKLDDFTQIIDVGDIIIQSLYQDILGNFGSDIAIVILKKDVEFTAFVKPVCIDWQLHDITEHLSNNTLGMVVGMGITENDTFSKNLRAAYLPVIDDKECIQIQSRDFKKYITYTSFCAGWRNGTAVCNGDSGGGLVFPKSNNKSQWVLQGIVSVSPRRLGTFFCNTKFYTIFTKVGMYVEWIQNVLNKVHPERNYNTNDIIVF